MQSQYDSAVRINDTLRASTAVKLSEMMGKSTGRDFENERKIKSG